jgi:hypothetical protein
MSSAAAGIAAAGIAAAGIGRPQSSAAPVFGGPSLRRPESSAARVFGLAAGLASWKQQLTSRAGDQPARSAYVVMRRAWLVRVSRMRWGR